MRKVAAVHSLRIKRSISVESASRSEPRDGRLQRAEVALNGVLVQQRLRGAAQVPVPRRRGRGGARLRLPGCCSHRSCGSRSCGCSALQLYLVCQKHAEEALVLTHLNNLEHEILYSFTIQCNVIFVRFVMTTSNNFSEGCKDLNIFFINTIQY